MLRILIATLFLTVSAGSAVAQSDFPSRSIRMVVPYPPGGFTDLLARTIGQKMSQSLGQPIVVDNRGGGGSTIGTDIVAKAAPDGYTLLLAAVDLAINESLYKSLPYSAENDFTPVALVAHSPMVLVANAGSGISSVQELIEQAKAQPGRINYASGGNGTGAHLAMEQFKTRAGVDLTHIPYKGNGPATTAILGGEVSVMFLQMAIAAPHIEAGKLTALALPGAERSDAMPDVPTLSETVLPGFDVTPWFGVLAPAGTPEPIVQRLNTAIVDALNEPDVKEMLTRQGAKPASSSPQNFAQFIRSEIPRWAAVVEASGARVD